MSDAKEKELHQSIEKEAQWLKRIVENLLLVTRISESGESKIIKTPEVVEEIVAAAAEKYKARFPALPVLVSVPEEVVVCPMDALLMEQTLLNLLQNAALHAANATFVKVLVTREQKHVKIVVLDNGCGMKQEFLNKFRMGRESGRDLYGDSSRITGIGLSVCDAIVTAHAGTLRLSNGANGGFCATILLPLEG
jgi:two-component system sensor histidine kinase KdpD